MIPIDKERVKRYHEELIEISGGMGGIRDEGLLESALASAFQSFGGEDLFPTVISKIARIAYGIIQNHPFVDGNKRIGIHMMVTLLDAYKINVDFTEDDIYNIGVGLANGEIDEDDLNVLILKRVKNHNCRH